MNIFIGFAALACACGGDGAGESTLSTGAGGSSSGTTDNADTGPGATTGGASTGAEVTTATVGTTGAESETGAESTGTTTGEGEGFVVRGVSGDDVLLDRLWDRGCIPGTDGNTWTQAHRTLIGLELTFTLVDFQNESKRPNCTDGRVGEATFTVQLTNDNVMIPIVWFDLLGEPAAAPAGLEDVDEANGAEGFMSSATVTPDTQARADQLNAAEFCGATDWAAGEGKDAVECLTGGFNPFKATIVVDDREMPWKIYDGVGTMFDRLGYPIDMPNDLPHSGPFDIR